MVDPQELIDIEENAELSSEEKEAAFQIEQEYDSLIRSAYQNRQAVVRDLFTGEDSWVPLYNEIPNVRQRHIRTYVLNKYREKWVVTFEESVYGSGLVLKFVPKQFTQTES